MSRGNPAKGSSGVLWGCSCWSRAWQDLAAQLSDSSAISGSALLITAGQHQLLPARTCCRPRRPGASVGSAEELRFPPGLHGQIPGGICGRPLPTAGCVWNFRISAAAGGLIPPS